MKRMLTYILLLIGGYTVEATTYYISNTGNDSFDGKRQLTAWNSLGKLKAAMNFMVTGDSILFESGSIFIGELNVTKSGLYLGSYNSGSKPIISGAIGVDKWSLVQPNIWMSECTACIEEPVNLFIDGAMQPLGRHPNKNYLTYTNSSNPDLTITDKANNFKNDFWNDAELVVKSSRWTIDKLLIRKYQQNIFYLSSAPSYPLAEDFGYFIQKHIATLDQPGEWFFDNKTKRLYLYLAQKVKPSDHIIEVSIINTGLQVTYAYDIIVENLIFQKHRAIGISAANCNGLRLRNLEIKYSGENGIEVKNSREVCLENCMIKDAHNNGIEWSGNSESIITHNTISRIGIYAGRGNSGNGTHIGLRLYANEMPDGNNLIEHNTIDSTGYSGIDFRTGKTTISDNTISNFCLVKDDGGGIYTWGNSITNNIIVGNTINRGIGNGNGTNQPEKLFVYGIYIDDRSSDITIKKNNISGCATAGIFIHNAKAIHVVGNTASGNGTSMNNTERGQFYVRLDTLGKLAGNVNLSLHVANNNWIANSEASYCIYLSGSKKTDLKQLGIFSVNHFSIVNPQRAVAELYLTNDICSAPEEFKLKDWQLLTQYEKGSDIKILYAKIKAHKNLPNMIDNGSMTTNLKGWYAWPQTSVLLHQKSKLFANASLKAIIPQGNAEVLVYHEGISLIKDQLYRLSFSARSQQKTKLEFTPLMEKSPWQALGNYMCFSIDTDMRQYTYYFRPTATQKKSRVNFKSGVTFWLDNVTLHAVQEPH